jgi:CO/xanthine dehydrogenase Mo-binding subunit
MPEGDVRVICTDVGGSYGIKVHVYPDEVAVAVIAGVPGGCVRIGAGGSRVSRDAQRVEALAMWLVGVLWSAG